MTVEWIDPQMHSSHIDYFSYNGFAATLNNNYVPLCGCIALANLSFCRAAARTYNAQVEEASQKRVDNILKQGAGCHSNHMMRQAGLFKGIQLLLAFPSASHGPAKDKEKRRKDEKI